MSRVRVWYQLDGRLGSVKIPADDCVDDLKKAIKEVWGTRIPCAFPEIQIFVSEGAAEHLREDSPIPTETTAENALFVVVPVTEKQKNFLLTKRMKGLLYSTIDKVWAPQAVPFAGSFKNLCRPRGYDGVAAYSAIVRDAESEPTVKSINLKSESEANEETNETLDVDIFGNGPASRAHLIPADKLCSATYGILALAVVGALHLLNVLDRARAILALWTLIHGLKQGENSGWGLQNLPSNFVVLPDPHKTHFDENGEWIIVPIMDLDGVKEWKESEEYYALVIAGSTSGGASTRNKNEHIYRRLLRGSDYEDEEMPFLEKCNEKDIRAATTLLQHFVKGVADVLELEGCKNRGGTNCVIAPSDLLTSKRPGEESKGVQEKKVFMTNAREALLKDGKVAVPMLKQADLSKLTLMKVLIRKLPGVDGVTDPMLLGIKAAVQWSQRQSNNGYKLFPAFGNPDPEEDPADVRASEAYRELSMRSSFDPRFAALQTVDDPSPMLSRFCSSRPGGEPTYDGPR